MSTVLISVIVADYRFLAERHRVHETLRLYVGQVIVDAADGAIRVAKPLVHGAFRHAAVDAEALKEVA